MPTVIINGAVCVSIKVPHQILDLFFRNLGTGKYWLKANINSYHLCKLSAPGLPES